MKLDLRSLSFILSLVITISASVFAQSSQNIYHSADFYRRMQNQYLNKPITVYVSSVMAGGGPLYNLIDGHRGFLVFTDDGESNGTIEAAVPLHLVESFVKRYGTSGNLTLFEGELITITRPLTGILLKYKSDTLYKGELLYILYSGEQDSSQKQEGYIPTQNGKLVVDTGSYYWALQDQYLNKTVTVYVSHLINLWDDSPIRHEDIPPEHEFLIATTYNGSEDGGSIHVAVQVQNLRKTIKKYGKEPRPNPSYGEEKNESRYKTLPLTGTLLRNKQGRPYILYLE